MSGLVFTDNFHSEAYHEHRAYVQQQLEIPNDELTSGNEIGRPPSLRRLPGSLGFELESPDKRAST